MTSVIEMMICGDVEKSMSGVDMKKENSQRTFWKNPHADPLRLSPKIPLLPTQPPPVKGGLTYDDQWWEQQQLKKMVLTPDKSGQRPSQPFQPTRN